MTRMTLSLIVWMMAAQGCTTQKLAKPVASDQSSVPIKYVAFGDAPVQPDAPQVTVEQIIASPDQYNGKTLRISGTVKAVCAKKGCWLQLGEGDEKALFVKFTCPIDGRLIPMEAVGKPAVVEGTVKVIEMSEDSARHYKEDAGASPEEIAKIVGPQKRVTIASPAAKIAGL